MSVNISLSPLNCEVDPQDNRVATIGVSNSTGKSDPVDAGFFGR
jgi:hypothetical protein